MSKAARSLCVVHRAGKLFDCLRVPKSIFSTYVLPHLEYCATVWMPSAESYLSLLDSVVRSAETLCEDELCCLGHRKKVNALCLLCNIYHIADYPLHEYLPNFIAVCNTRASATLGELALGFPHCRTDQISLSFPPVAILLPSDVFGGGTLSTFKGAMNLCLQMA